SIYIPEKYKAGILISDRALWRDMCRMTDAFCDELFDGVAAPERMVVSPICRLACDVERFRNDDMEPMAKRGMGLMYTRTVLGRKLREYDENLRNDVLKEYYDPHHARLTAAVDAALESCGRCTILDGHSFNSTIPFKWDCVLSMPDFDIGTDAYHTPPALRDALVNKVRELGYTVRVNSPFAGSITPMKYYGEDRRVVSVMIEVNRRLYMNQRDMTKSAGFARTKEVCQILMGVAEQFNG
ncbi:MAG: N-formylglutamate amidohydrolase, partial [Eubacteriales bacterium]|nr:N-formylglutamate amidohydrolase [Eubacteriales bacterium]